MNNKVRTGLAVTVILLFIGLAFAPTINANVGKTVVEPKSDLCCEGRLLFKYVEPGVTRTASFSVLNIGDPGSKLDWEISDNPSWGEWTFHPISGEDLTPEDGEIIVKVTVVFPNVPNQEFNGRIKVDNSENHTDFCYVDLIVYGPPPIEFWYFFIGKIHSPIITKDIMTFHADIVFVFWLIFPAKPIINEDIVLPNHYIGYIGKRFIFAFIKA